MPRITIFTWVYLVKYFKIFLLELMATNFSPSLGSYVLNKFPSISQWSDTGPSWPSCLAHLSTTCSRGAFTVVMCQSSVVNNFFKHLLLPNRWANLDQTWQECSLGGPLQKMFTEFDSMKNSGCHGNRMQFFK